MRLKAASVLIVVVSVVGLISAQQDKEKRSPKESPPLTIKLNLNVVDFNNIPVTNLAADRFRVFENDELQTVTLVEPKSGPLHLQFGIDSSGSMRTSFGKTVAAANLFVDGLTPEDKCELFRFVSSDNIETVVDLTSDKRKLKRGIANLYVEGGHTALIDALYFAASHLDESSKSLASIRRAIVVFTDGENRSSVHKQDELFKLLERIDVPVFLIAPRGDFADSFFAEDKATKLLNKLAVSTGAVVYFVKSPDEFQQAVNAVWLELRSRYVVSYNSTNPRLDGKHRKIRVEIVAQKPDEKFAVFVRGGYTAPKN